MRLDKMLAHMGYGTRKQVRQLIRSKKVKVDDEVVTKHGFHVNVNDQEVTVSGNRVNYIEYVYLMLHKPADYVSATYDQFELTVIDLVPLEYRHFSLAPVGRLDKDTEGLILLTNDGQLNHRLTSPRSHIWKTYEALVSDVVMDEHIAQFKDGVILDDGYKTKEAHLQVISCKDGQSKIELSITEGKFHQVKRMFQAIGMEVLYLKRTKIGNLKLDKALDVGEIRPLNEKEMRWIDHIKEGEGNGSIN